MTVLREGIVGGALNVFFIYKFLRILTTPFAETDAFKLGIIDEKGKILKKQNKLKTSEEKDSYTLMHRLVWKMKRLMEKIPFGKSRLASYAAALWLIKEEKNFEGTDQELQESFLTFLESDWKEDAMILKENYEGDMDKKSFSKLRQEGIDIKKASMSDVIKDFQSSDAPQFKGKSDKKKKEMAIAAKLSKEEIEVDEVLVMGKAPKQMKDNEKLKWFNKLKSGQTINLWYDSSMAKGTKWREFEIGRKSKSKKFNLEKISMQMMRDGKAGGVKFYLYNRQGNISMAWGDMAVSLISMKEEFDSTTIAVEVDEAIKSKTADAGMECQECGKKFRAKLSTLEYGRTKCPQCKSTDIDFAFGEGLEEARRMPKNVRDYMKFAKGQGPNPDQVLDVKDVDKWVKEIKKGIKAGWVSVASSNLGGDENVAILIKLTLEKENDWPHKILHNASFGMIRIDVDGGMEMFASGHKVKNMRKTSVKSARDVVSKINTWIKKIAEEVCEPSLKSFNQLTEGWKKGKYKVTDGKTGKVLKTFNSGAKAQKYVDDIFQKGDYEALTVELDESHEPCPKCDGAGCEHCDGKGFHVHEMPNRANMEKINTLIKKHSGKFKWRDEVLYVEKGIEKDVTSLIKKGSLTATVKVSSNPMKEGVELDEEVFNWYIIKGNTEKGKVAHVGTERELKLKIRKPTFPPNHVLLKSRKDLKIGDNWKGSMGVSEEVELVTEGRPKQDKDFVPDATKKDHDRTGIWKKYADAQQKHYTPQEIESIARKYKQKVADVQGGKTWDWEWLITLMNGIRLDYDYGSNTTTIKKWKLDKKKLETYLSRYRNEHETIRDLKGDGGIQVIGLETAFELIEQVELNEAAPANSVAGGNVNLDPFKKKRKNAKVQTEMFAGQKVFVVSPERFYESRLGKSRYQRYEKYVGNDKLGEAIRQYGRNNPKNSIILKNSGNGAMLYLKYGRQ